jgi:uncharacterized membrane protein (UPF0136 family)
MNPKSKIILLSYIALLSAGGVMGYIKSGSLMSLVMSQAFGLALLALVLLCKKIQKPLTYISMVLLFIDSFFTYRFLKTWKIMPSGIFALLTFCVLVVVLKTNGQLRNKARRAP